MPADRSRQGLIPLANVVTSLNRAVRAKDPYTMGHNERVASYAVNLARRVGVDSRTIDWIRVGGQLHDVGKVGISDAVLQKSMPFTADERLEMRLHSDLGFNICEPLGLAREVLDIVRHHHERLDGSGYPDRLHGSQITLAVQIVGLVDIVDALLTTRVYRAALAMDNVWDILYEEALSGLHDPQLVETCIQNMASGELFECCAHEWDDKLQIVSKPGTFRERAQGSTKPD
jgi:putative two-component system response regulator